MVLKIEHNETNKTHVLLLSENKHINFFLEFDSTEFNIRYKREDQKRLKEDMIDTCLNTIAIPLTREELMDECKVFIFNGLLNKTVKL